MKARLKLSGCASNLLAHEDLGHFEEAHHRNIQAKFYNEKFPLVYESDKIGDSLYEKHAATLKHKCGKRIVTLPLLSFSLIFLWALFGLFFLERSHGPHPHFYEDSLVSTILSSLGQCSNNDDHHTFIYLQLNITTRCLEQSMTLYECLRRCTGMCNDLA